MNLPTHITRAQITAAFQPSEGEYAEITQVGRWLYAICIRDGLMVTNPPWYRLGRRSAQRKARRELARRVQQDPTTVAELVHERQRSARRALLAAAVLAAIATGGMILHWLWGPFLGLAVGIYGYARWARGWVMGATYVMAKDRIEDIERQIAAKTGGQA